MENIENLTFTDLTRPEVLTDPYQLFRRLRVEDPIHKDPTCRRWMVTRYDDVAAVLSDSRFSAERLVSRSEEKGVANAVTMALSRQMLFLDPPDHTRLRKLFAKAFTPRRLEVLRPQIVGLTDGLLNNAEQKGTFDFIKDFAVPLPVTVIAQMLGVPTEDHARMRNWSGAFGRLISGRALSGVELIEAEQGILAFIAYFKKLIDQRKHSPENDMLSDLIAVEEEGDRLDEEELIMNLILLLTAGHGTTTHLLGNGLLALLQNRAQWELLSTDDTLLPSAVNELLRFDAPVQATSREATENVQLGDKMILAGDRVTLFLGSANHDPDHFENPDALNIRRTGARMLSFGHGIHTCLGAVLARMEAQVAFQALSHRFPNAHLKPQTLQRTPGISFRGLQHLLVTLD
jgi:cytochrome P450